VQGSAFAGGVGLVAQAHVVITTSDAMFSLPEVRIGMWPFVIWRSLVHAIGERRALELSLTGRRFSAQEALAIGLAHQISAPDALAATARSVAAAIAEDGGEAVHRGMILTRQSRHLDREGAIGLALALRADQLASNQYRDRVEQLRTSRKT
jgi:enoyl-CoA hydratase/carnithine racemase